MFIHSVSLFLASLNLLMALRDTTVVIGIILSPCMPKRFATSLSPCLLLSFLTVAAQLCCCLKKPSKIWHQMLPHVIPYLW